MTIAHIRIIGFMSTVVALSFAAGCSGDGGSAPNGSGGNTPGSGGAASVVSGGAPGSDGLTGTGGALPDGTGGTPGSGGTAGGDTPGGGSSSGGAPAVTGGREGSTGGQGGGAAGNTGLGGSSPGSGGRGGNNGAGNLKATMVVRGAGTATAGDMVMMGRLTAYGFKEVVIVSDANVTAASVVGSDLVVISSSAESGPLKDKLKNVAIPVFCIEDAEFKLMGMASSGDHDANVSQVVTVPGNPLVGSATGTVAISGKPGELGWGTPAASAVIGATMPGTPTHAAVFGYAKGSQMVGMVAPARRAGFAIREALAASLNAAGLQLFDSILAWVMQ